MFFGESSLVTGDLFGLLGFLVVRACGMVDIRFILNIFDFEALYSLTSLVLQPLFCPFIHGPILGNANI